MRANYRKFQGGWAWLSWAIPAAAGLLGAMTGQTEAKKNRQLQERMATEGIQMRVKDAEKAGVHPLYALGAQTPTFTPVSSGAGEILAQTGQNVGRAIRDSQLQELQMKGMEAGIAKDQAQAVMYANEAARIRQAMNSGGSGVYKAPQDVVVGAYSDRHTRVTEHPLYEDAVKLEPDTMVSRGGSGVTAGREHPAMREFEFPGGHRILLPATGQGGIPEEIDAAMLPHILAANRQKYGSNWWNEVGRYLIYGVGPDDTKIRSQPVTGKIRY